MNTTNTNGPIEKKEKQKAGQLLETIDLRDYFAAKAMQGLVERNKNLDLTRHEAHVTSTSAYQMADAMLKAREA